MRMRRKKNRETRFENCADLVVREPIEWKGRWQEYWKNERPIHVEIGCGKGKFILEMAQKFPEINFIAIEKCLDVLILAMEKIKNHQVKNVAFLLGDAALLCDIFERGEVERIYLNFSDPWKKAKQAKRRLTYRTFLEKYEKVLAPDGEVHFKTDNRPLFDFSLAEFDQMGLEVSELTYDLHHSGFEGNVMTEYEENFSSKGVPINRCVIRFPVNSKK